ncbi:MAG: IPT/TIG domain-containing protein, partial [Anaerolineales bacterium]|nr:IPT/TIG domain-containing protein [Anaerolineales bacterium]
MIKEQQSYQFLNRLLRTAPLVLISGLLYGIILTLPVFADGQTAVSAPLTHPIQSYAIAAAAQITPTATSTATPSPTATATKLPRLKITAIEPGRMSNETGGVLTVYGENFTSGTVIRIVGYGVIQSTFVNNEVVTGIVPPGIDIGRYNIQVGLGNQDGSNFVLEGAFEIFGPTPTAAPTDTPVPTATAVYVFGQPQLAIQSAGSSPAVPLPGESFELTMAISNLGNWTAIDIELELQSTDIAVPASGSNVRIIPRIGVEETITVTLPLNLSQNVPDGAQNLNFNIDYYDLDGRSYNTQQSVGLAVSDVTATPTPGPEQPRLVLTTYNVEPTGPLAPGDIFDLSLNFTNVGNAATDNVIITLGGPDGTQLQPFALINSGNIRYVESIDTGETIEVKQTLLVAGTAVSGVFNLPIDLTYDGSDGTPQS